jgi:hypothetical protein
MPRRSAALVMRYSFSPIYLRINERIILTTFIEIYLPNTRLIFQSQHPSTFFPARFKAARKCIQEKEGKKMKLNAN